MYSMFGLDIYKWRLCRGFGFVTFSDLAGVDKVLAHGTHNLDGKKVRKKKEFERGEGNQNR